MQHKRLVIDANILIRAVFGQRVRELIANASDHVAFYVAEFNFDEACRYIEQLAPKRGIPEDAWRASLDTLMRAIQLIGMDELQLVETQAPRVRQLRSQVLVFARAHFQKCHYNSANCSGAAGFSIPNA